MFLGDANFGGTGSDQTAAWGSVFTAFQSRVQVSGSGYIYSQIVNVENIYGSEHNDTLYGSTGANLIQGAGGDDVLAGNGGADTLYGGNGNDTILMTAAQMATVSSIKGDAGTDTLIASGWSFSAGSIASGGKLNTLETIDVRNSTSGDSVGLTYQDIQSATGLTTTSNLTLKLDSGDTFTASGFAVLQTGDTLGTGDNHYHYYTTAGHAYTDTGFQATLTVHYGP